MWVGMVVEAEAAVGTSKAVFARRSCDRKQVERQAQRSHGKPGFHSVRRWQVVGPATTKFAYAQSHLSAESAEIRARSKIAPLL